MSAYSDPFDGMGIQWSIDHVKSAAAKANKVLEMLNKTFVSRDSEIWKNWYVSIVRSNIEYAVQAWCPYLVMYIDALEKIQRRAC